MNMRLPWLVRDKDFYKRLVMLALPMALQNIISFAVGLADNYMVSSLGENAVSGIYLANQVQNILHMLVMGLGAALVIIATQYFGKNDTRSVKTIMSIALKAATIVGLCATLLMLLNGRGVLSIFTDKEDVIDQGIAYVQYIAWSYLFFCITNVLLSGMRCTGMVRIGLMVSIVTLVVNIGLNYLLIFGKLGFPAMGVAGAALATLIARIAECAIVALYVRCVDNKLMFRVKDLLLHNQLLLKDFFRYGIPVIMGDLFWGIGGAAQAMIIGRLSESVITASAIVANIFQIFAVFVYGMAGAGALMVGQTIGRNEFDLAKQYAKTLQVIYLLVGIVSSAVLFLLKDTVLGLYDKLQPDTIAFATQFLLVMCVTIIGTSYQMSSLQIVRSGGATHFILVNDLIFVWLVVLPLAYLSAFVWHAPMWVVFACLKCDQVLKCFVAVVKINRFKWMKNLTRQTGGTV